MGGERGNILVLQGGGPTAVLNSSLYGVIDEAQKSRSGPAGIGRILGARHGVAGLIRGDWVDLGELSPVMLQRLSRSPGASLGSTRHVPTAGDLDQILQRLQEQDIRWVLMIGGNGSMRGAQLISDAAARARANVGVIGVPKTVDNDIPCTDRCPGFGSAARYAAQSVRDLGMDVRGLPQPVSLFETMGRSVGWLTGATALAKLDEASAPHLIYLPERSFEVWRFLGDVERVVSRHGWCVAVVCEGLRDPEGRPVYETAEGAQRDALSRPLPGGVAMFLADVIARELKLRCRYEKPGLCGRASMLHASAQDLADAERVGRAAVNAALAGNRAQMVALRPLQRSGIVPEQAQTELVPLARVAGGERVVPADWIGDAPERAVAAPFLEYVAGIVGDLVDYEPPLADRAERFFPEPEAR